MTTEPARQRRTELAQVSRQRMLDAGVELLAERQPSPLEGVRGSEVAERAGLTPGAFYHHWATQEDYRFELRAYLGEDRDVEGVERRAKTIRDRFGRLGLVEALRITAREELDSLLGDPYFRIVLALQSSPNLDDRERARSQYTVWENLFAPFFEDLFTQFGARLRPGLSFAWFARSVFSLIEGFALQRLAGLDAIEFDDSWNDFDAALFALIVGVSDNDRLPGTIADAYAEIVGADVARPPAAS